MINKDLIHEKVGELMNLTVECEMDSQDYDDLITLLQQRIEHTKPVSLQKLILKNLLKIKEIDDTIEIIPCEIIRIKGLKVTRHFSLCESLLTKEDYDKIFNTHKEIRPYYYAARIFTSEVTQDSYIPTFDIEADCSFLLGYDIRNLTKDSTIDDLKKIKIMDVNWDLWK